MGDPKKRKKQYKVPKKLWQKARLESEKRQKEVYGLKNKRELWKFDTMLRQKRKNARDLLALQLNERLKREKDLVESLKTMGLLNERATLEDVLSLSTEALLERRLQTMVLKKGLANSIKQARQFIVHGHIGILGKKVSKPNYIVSKKEETHIAFYGKPLKLSQPVLKKKDDLKKDFEAAIPLKEKEEMQKVNEMESAEQLDAVEEEKS